MKRFLSDIFFLIVLTFIVNGCKKSDSTSNFQDPPLVVTLNMATDVSQTTANSGGAVTNTNTPVTAFGVCWSSTNQTPTINDSKTNDSATTKVWSSSLTGLTANTTYYVRAYATNGSATGYGAVVKFTTRNTPVPTATVSTIAGSTTNGFANGTGAAAMFDGPGAMVFNPMAGSLYITDNYNNLIRTVTTAGVVGSLTNGTLGYANGTLSSALFYGPKGMCVDATGNTYVADMGNNVIRKITPNGTITTFAGTGVAGYLDGTGTGAMFNSPQAVAVDASGNVYVADRGNNMIRKITSAGVVSSIAGYPASAGGLGYLDATAGVAKFNYPIAMAIDATGAKLYIADLKNNAIRVVSTADGVVTTLAGSPVQTNVVGQPTAITIDGTGNLFVADQTGRIIEITPNNGLYTIAGALNNAGYADGTGTSARFNNPQGIALDAAGNIYVADYGNNTIRKIKLQ